MLRYLACCNRLHRLARRSSTRTDADRGTRRSGAAPAGRRQRHPRRLRRRTRRRTQPARRQSPRAGDPAARLRAALRRCQPEDPPPRAARLRHRGPGRGRREAARLSGTDAAPGHGQRRALHHARTLRTRPPHLRGRRTRRRARARRVRRIWCADALAHADALAACADALALLDAAQSAAKLAESGTWCRPW